jgi:outer membrane lipoprotein-sorting protein
MLPAQRLNQQRRAARSSSVMPVPESRLAAKFLFFAAAIVLSTPSAARAQAKPDHLKSVLSEMDAASAKFTSAQADLRQELFTKAVQDTETQTGQIYFLRKAGATQMGMKLLPPDAKPGTPPAQVFEFKDGKLRVFNPGTNQIDEISATGKNQSTAEIVMTLGFGGSGADLEKAWTITDLDPESLKDGNQTVQTEKLDLVSKDASIRNNYATHITIWVDAARGVSLKQISFTASDGKPTGDTRTVYYSNIRPNLPVDVRPFAINCKGKCSVISH